MRACCAADPEGIAQITLEKEDLIIESTTKNAFIVSVTITIIAFLLLFE
jgi:hypothetical protein